METQLLVCEGNCNPGVDEIDRLVDAYRQSTRYVREHMPAVTRDLVVDLRSLQHTPHTLKTAEWATCTVCGTTRRFARIGGVRSWAA